MKKRILFVCIVLALLVGTICTTILHMRDDVDLGNQKLPDAAVRNNQVKRALVKSLTKCKLKSCQTLACTKPTIVIDDEDELSPAERQLMDRIEKALDEENFRDAIACVEKSCSCTNAEIRQAMVDALGWFGEKALPELSLFLADTDEDVRDSARNEWSTAVSQIDDEHAKIDAVEMVMHVIDDEDFLEDISTEYIGVDEKLAVESLARIIVDDKCSAGVAKAKETYEFVTGDEWISEQEAARWIAEEYKPEE